MKINAIIIFLILLPTLVNAGDEKLIEEKEIKKWGYSTLKFEQTSNDGVKIQHQLIKSIKEEPGMKNTYYYYSLKQECFTSIFSAVKRKISLLFLGEKEYKLSELSGKCIRIIETSANSSTFKEQPRIFSLFNKYLNNENT